MTEKRFTCETKTQGNRAYTQWYDNRKRITSSEYIINMLNALHEENEHIKNTIQDMIQTEKTELGKSILKQLWSRIQ